MDGSDGSTDLRMSIPENSACFVRTTAKQDGSLLLLGEPLPLLKLSSLQYLSKDTVRTVHHAWNLMMQRDAVIHLPVSSGS